MKFAWCKTVPDFRQARKQTPNADTRNQLSSLRTQEAEAA